MRQPNALGAQLAAIASVAQSGEILKCMQQQFSAWCSSMAAGSTLAEHVATRRANPTAVRKLLGSARQKRSATSGSVKRLRQQ